MTKLCVTAGLLNIELTPEDADRDAAWELYIELLTRISTQPLATDQGSDQAALESVYALFPLTRDTIKRHGRQCNEFAKIAILVLNQIIRPFTTKWHGRMEAGDFGGPQTSQEFRDELACLQQDLKNYTKMLADMAAVEDLTEIADSDSNQRS